MARIDEIADDVFRICVHDVAGDFQFNHFLVRDEQPVLFHLGSNAMFRDVETAVRSVLDPATIRWLGFSHFESDECGALNRWLAVAPRSEPLCSFLAAHLNVQDFAERPPVGQADGAVISTGEHEFVWIATPHVPHSWDAGMLFERTGRTLFCSDLFAHYGNPSPLVETDVVEPARAALLSMSGTPFDHSTPITGGFVRTLGRLAQLSPRTLAIMHGSSFSGDGARALQELSGVMRRELG